MLEGWTIGIARVDFAQGADIYVWVLEKRSHVWRVAERNVGKFQVCAVGGIFRRESVSTEKFVRCLQWSEFGYVASLQ